MRSQTSENTSATRLCTASDRPRSARNQSVSRAAVYQPTTSVSQRYQCAAEAVLTGRMRKRSAPGARMNRSSDRGQPHHDHHQEHPRDQAVQQRRPVEQQEGAERADRERGDPAEPEREPAADGLEPRLDRVERHRDQALAKARGRPPVEPLDQDAQAQEHRHQQQRGPDALLGDLGVEQPARPAPARAAPSGIAASEARMCWRTAIAGAVMSAEIPELCLVSRSWRRRCLLTLAEPRADVRVVHEREQLADLGGRSLVGSGGLLRACRRTASASINHRAKRFRPTSRTALRNGSPMHGLRSASGSLPALPVICTPPAGCPPPGLLRLKAPCRAAANRLRDRSGGSACRVWGAVLSATRLAGEGHTVVSPRQKISLGSRSKSGKHECLPAPRHRGWPAATPTPCSISRRSAAGSSRLAPIWLRCSRP